MPADWSQVDPQWAWSNYSPDARAPWNRRRAAHLYRRAGFAATTRELDEATAAEPATAIRRLLGAATDKAFEQDVERLASSVLATGKPKNLAAAWLYRMLHTPQQHLEKVVLFWHGHFATSLEKVNDAQLMLEQNALLRRAALGRFGELAQAISRDPAMLIYLDSATNRKSHPNENYARELMELFAMGVGNYSEHDVQELARAFTGWEIVRGRGRLNARQHDERIKTLLSQSGNFDSRQAVDIVVEHAATPRFLTTKLVRYFVADEPLPPPALIEPLAREFQERGLDVSWLVERILSSQLFFSELAIGRKMRSPVEVGVGTLRALEGTTNLYELSAGLEELGHCVFYPPSVKGWDGGRAWINSATLLGRTNLIGRLAVHKQSRFGGGDLESLATRHGLHTPEATVDWIVDLLFAVPLGGSVREYLLDVAREPAQGRSRQIARLLHAAGALPEFQLG